MKRLCFLLLLLPLIGFSQGLRLSEQAEIHILTCGPYQGELYSAFGHSAIRVKDPRKGYDILYNYGIFDFDQPNFYLNFARGYLHYKLGVTDYERFRDFYIYSNRYIHEQVLNLTLEQKQQYFDFLQWNARPENQYYYYDYFYDNCATRVRDGLKTTFKDSLQFDDSYIQTQYTIRDLTDLYLVQQPWGDLGIDLCLGMPMDKVAEPQEYMFLPDYIEKGFNHASIIRDGKKVPLVRETIITYAAKPEASESSLISPTLLFSIVLLIGVAITLLGHRNKRLYKGFDIVLFTIIGLVGWLLLLLWIATDHKAAAVNFNILWAIPFHFPIVFLLLKKNKPVFLSKYFMLTAVINLLTLGTWAFLPQDLHNSLIPLVILLSIRAYYIHFYLSKHENT